MQGSKPEERLKTAPLSGSHWGKHGFFESLPTSKLYPKQGRVVQITTPWKNRLSIPVCGFDSVFLPYRRKG